jgi:hypothetical protein
VSAPVCIGEPISWLRLERHRLGELDAAERDRVAAHLAACAACAACAAEVGESPVLPALAAPAPAPAVAGPVSSSTLTRIRRALFGAHRAGAFAAVAALAALVLVVTARARPPHPKVGLSTGWSTGWSTGPSSTLPGIKGGGDVAIEIVRERQGAIAHDATTFAPDDRFQVLVTCPAGRLLFWQLLVRDAQRTDFPLASAGPIPCGNRIPLPGAFRLSGAGPVDVCLVLGGDPLDRASLARVDAAQLGRRGACATLRPE